MNHDSERGVNKARIARKGDCVCQLKTVSGGYEKENFVVICVRWAVL